MEKRRAVGFEIKTVSNMIKRRIAKSPAVMATDKMTGTHGWYLGYIYDRMDYQDVFQRDIEEAFQIRRSTATGILQLMEKNGLIIRESVDYDARLKKISLTPKAIAMHEALIKEIDVIEAQITEGLTAEEIQTLYSILEKIKRNVE